jgi:hypothetical protein
LRFDRSVEAAGESVKPDGNAMTLTTDGAPDI